MENVAVKNPCSCCGYLVVDELPGPDDICPICFWEDDVSQLRFPMTTGANHVSLIAREPIPRRGQGLYGTDGTILSCTVSLDACPSRQLIGGPDLIHDTRPTSRWTGARAASFST